MSDDKSQRRGGDQNRISMAEDYEVQYWTKELGVSREELEEAVRSVGNTADKVRAHLSGRRPRNEE